MFIKVSLNKTVLRRKINYKITFFLPWLNFNFLTNKKTTNFFYRYWKTNWQKLLNEYWKMFLSCYFSWPSGCNQLFFSLFAHSCYIKQKSNYVVENRAYTLLMIVSNTKSFDTSVHYFHDASLDTPGFHFVKADYTFLSSFLFYRRWKVKKNGTLLLTRLFVRHCFSSGLCVITFIWQS